MATTKTIQPTGTTITIPAMTDRPDASVYSTDVERITDAVNALNSEITVNYKGTYTKLSDITSMLSGIIATMAENERRIIRLSTGTDTSLTPFNSWNDYIGWIIKTNQTGTYWQSHFVGRDGSDVEIGCNNGTISAHSLSSDIASIRKVIVDETDVTTSSNGNFSIIGLSSSSFMLLTITVTSPDDIVAIPYKYGTGAGLLGGHAMSCLAAQTAIANMNLHIKYAYVAI